MNITLSEYCQLAKEHNCIPLMQEIDGDMETPVSLMKKIEARFLLESVNTENRVGRYSFVSRGELCRITLKNGDVTICRRGENRITPKSPHPLSLIQQTIGEFTTPPLPQEPPFLCSFLGYLGYESVQYWEDIPVHPAGDDDLPDGIWVLPRTTLIHDLVSRKITCVVTTLPEEGTPEKAYLEGVKELKAVLDQIKNPVLSLEDVGDSPRTGKNTAPPRSVFIPQVEEMQKAIVAGEVIQGVLSRKIRRKTAVPAETLYRTLRKLNPSPYLFYLDFGDFQIVGASPEVMIQARDGKLLLKPIAGTRRRGNSPEKDKALAEELKADPKEVAEHLMLVDLGRNDLGRVAKPGTVKVKEYQKVEHYSHVMHLVSTLEAEQTPESDVFSLIGAVFPAGTLTGAPKIRAMELINQIETERRGPYGGMVFHMDTRGNIDSCITIRTMVKRGNLVEVQAGAGIVHHSVPEKEFDETEAKAAALIKTIEEAEKCSC